jgi:hypothetical protein
MRRLLFAVVLLALTVPAFAKHGTDHTTLFSDITVADGDTASDIACAFCTVHIHGQVNGDIAVAFGTITVDDQRNISGDVATFGGDLLLGQEARVNGDVAIMAGDLKLGEGASIGGSKVISPSRLWLLIPLAPFLILGGIIWLIVYFVRQRRYRYPAYPQGRRP